MSDRRRNLKIQPLLSALNLGHPQPRAHGAVPVDPSSFEGRDAPAGACSRLRPAPLPQIMALAHCPSSLSQLIAPAKRARGRVRRASPHR